MIKLVVHIGAGLVVFIATKYSSTKTKQLPQHNRAGMGLPS